MKRAAEYRTRARRSLSGRYGTIIAAQLIYGMIIFTALLIFLIGLIFVVLGANLVTGVNGIYSSGTPFSVILLSIIMAVIIFIVIIAQVLLNCGIRKLTCKAWKREPASLGDMFYGFKGKAPLRVIGISFLMGILEFIFVIPYEICAFTMVFHDRITPILVVLLILTYLLAIAGAVCVSLFFGLSMYAFLDMPELGVIQCMKASLHLTRGRRWNLFCLYISFVGWIVLGLMSFGVGMLWITPYIHCTLFQFYEDLKLEKEQQIQAAQVRYN